MFPALSTEVKLDSRLVSFFFFASTLVVLGILHVFQNMVDSQLGGVGFCQAEVLLF